MSAARLLTYDELARDTGVVKGTLKRWKHEGMPCQILEGGRVRFERAAVDAWIKGRRSDPNKLRRLRSVTFRRRAVVYFALGETGLIKIGWSSDATRREHEVDVEVLASIDGDKNLEASFHRAFSADHVEGEWFQPSARLRAFIDGIVKLQTVRIQ